MVGVYDPSVGFIEIQPFFLQDRWLQESARHLVILEMAWKRCQGTDVRAGILAQIEAIQSVVET